MAGAGSLGGLGEVGFVADVLATAPADRVRCLFPAPARFLLTVPIRLTVDSSSTSFMLMVPTIHIHLGQTELYSVTARPGTGQHMHFQTGKSPRRSLTVRPDISFAPGASSAGSPLAI